MTTLLLWIAGAMAADAPSSEGSPYQIDLGRDLAISAVVGLASGLPGTQTNELLTPWCGLACDPDVISPFDQFALGKRSSAAGTVSDFTYVGSMVLPHALGAIDVATGRPPDGLAGYGTDTVVLLQTLSIALGVSNGVKFIIRRPRPYAYDANVPDAERLEGIASLSFYSGHTTASFSMATAYSRLFMLRHPTSWLVVPMWLATYGIAGTTGVLRIYAGDHFPTDVLVGAVTGIGWGLFVPWTHQIRNGGPSRRAALQPLLVPGGAGVSLQIAAPR